MDRVDISIGTKILFHQKEAIIIRLLDLSTISIQELKTNIIHTIDISEISRAKKPNLSHPNRYVDLLNDKEWERAKKRYEIIEPILGKRRDLATIEAISRVNNIHISTIYRWIKLYDHSGEIAALAGFKKNGGKGKSRIDIGLDTIIKEVIIRTYLTSEKKSIRKVIREISQICETKKLTPPHPNTIRNRIKSIDEETFIRGRFGNSVARDKFEPLKKHFPGADYPLSVVQIDHTKLDIILVDEHYRRPFQRPYLTLAVDVYSRIVVGFYLSFDPPGELGTGLCIANSILPKETWLEKSGVDGVWPIWGIMKTIHLDNAKEFRGRMLKMVCQNYGINIEYRPVATPNWGGHVERLLGTFSKEIHDLAGTTFSDPKLRSNYDSKDKASLTIGELEKWILTYIVNVYHKKIHSAIKMSPLQKYEEGILGGDNLLGTGLPPRLIDERRVKLDFMPFYERTIQEYGVLIDHIFYYDDVLRKFIHAKEQNGKSNIKRKFIFKRDPRDISLLYFYDPELNTYFEIPYRDTSKPSISIWEYNDVVRGLHKNKIIIDEESIFNAYREMEAIENDAIVATKQLNRISRYADKRNEVIHKRVIKQDSESLEERDPVKIIPFEDIDDEAFT